MSQAVLSKFIEKSGNIRRIRMQKIGMQKGEGGPLSNRATLHALTPYQV
jgi:hypothetical protein